MHFWRADNGEFGFKTRAHLGIRPWKAHVVDDCADVEAGTTYEDGCATARRNLRDRRPRVRLVIGNARRAGDGPDIKQMMDDALPLVDRQLCGSDIHALIQLHRVGVDDLTVQAMREIDAELRLACGGRTQDDDNARFRGGSGTHAGSQVATVYMTPKGASE